MKRILTYLLLAAAMPLQAQTLDERPAQNPEGKLFANSDLYYTSQYSITGAYPQWLEGDSFAYYGEGGWKMRVLDPAAGTVSEGDPSALNPARAAYRSVDGSVWWGDRCIAEGSDGIVYGEIVSRNEFGINAGLFPSPDGKKLAFYRKDETRVTKFPLLDITTRTGSLKEIRYPMNGMESELITLGVYDSESGKTIYLDVTDFTPERYLTNVTWTPDSKQIWIQVEARSQHEMHLNSYSASTGAFIRTLLTEENEAWIEPQDPVWFPGDRYDLFFYRTDNRDGYRALYLVDTLGSTPRRLTPAPADAAYVANTAGSVYYTSAEVSPIENHLFRVRLRRRGPDEPQRLTPERGWHKITMSPDCSQFIDRYSSFNVPGVTQVRNADGTFQQMILTALDPLDEYAQCRVELGTTPSADGQFDNYYRLFYPRGFDPSKKYPLIVYVYGGPHSQMVTDSWLGGIRMWEMLMAQRGYVVYVQDNRGTQNRGAAFEKAINRRCGTAEVEDQMAGIRALLDRAPWIDRSRIGVHGWSYGGFMTLSLNTRNPGFFKVAVAGGPVIDWQWYEVMYGERYMDTPETNPEGFAEASLIARAKDLNGRVLICQGLQDGTVVPQHSLSFVQTCIEEGVPVDWFPYPLDEHNMRGKARVHLYEKITDYFETFL